MTAHYNFSLRDWCGLVAGLCVGLVFSRFFASDDMMGPWLVILLGPPIVLLISPNRPILSWQIPIVTAAAAGALASRSPEDPASGAIASAVLSWFICSILSCPWVLIFHYRNRRFRQSEKAPKVPIAYVGMVVLVFVCCAVTFFGFVALVYPSDASDAQNRMFPIYGALAATGGIVLSILTERLARKLEVQKPVRGVIELLMLPGVLLGIGGIVSLFWVESPRHSAVDESTVCIILAGMEALVTMIWLTRLDRRDQCRAVQQPQQ